MFFVLDKKNKTKHRVKEFSILVTKNIESASETELYSIID